MDEKEMPEWATESGMLAARSGLVESKTRKARHQLNVWIESLFAINDELLEVIEARDERIAKLEKEVAETLARIARLEADLELSEARIRQYDYGR